MNQKVDQLLQKMTPKLRAEADYFMEQIRNESNQSLAIRYTMGERAATLYKDVNDVSGKGYGVGATTEKGQQLDHGEQALIKISELFPDQSNSLSVCRRFFFSFDEDDLALMQKQQPGAWTIGWSSHIRSLLTVSDPATRKTKLQECVSHRWSLAELDHELAKLDKTKKKTRAVKDEKEGGRGRLGRPIVKPRNPVQLSDQADTWTQGLTDRVPTWTDKDGGFCAMVTEAAPGASMEMLQDLKTIGMASLEKCKAALTALNKLMSDLQMGLQVVEAEEASRDTKDASDDASEDTGAGKGKRRKLQPA